MTNCNEFAFSSAIRRFRVHRHTWTPHIGQQLQKTGREKERERATAITLSMRKRAIANTFKPRAMDGAQSHIYI